jgi:hypothetical protein
MCQHELVRTGIRCGIAPSDVWHVRFPGAGVACGAKQYLAAVTMVGDDMESVCHRIERNGGTPCRRCLKRLGGRS